MGMVSSWNLNYETGYGTSWISTPCLNDGGMTETLDFFLCCCMYQTEFSEDFERKVHKSSRDCLFLQTLQKTLTDTYNRGIYPLSSQYLIIATLVLNGTQNIFTTAKAGTFLGTPLASKQIYINCVFIT